MKLNRTRKLFGGGALLLVVLLFFWALVPTAASKRNVIVELADYQYHDKFVSLRLINRSGQDVMCSWKDRDWYSEFFFIVNPSEARQQSLLVPKSDVRELKLASLLTSDTTRRVQMTFTPLRKGTHLKVEKLFRPLWRYWSIYIGINHL